MIKTAIPMCVWGISEFLELQSMPNLLPDIFICRQLPWSLLLVTTWSLSCLLWRTCYIVGYMPQSHSSFPCLTALSSGLGSLSHLILQEYPTPRYPAARLPLPTHIVLLD